MKAPKHDARIIALLADAELTDRGCTDGEVAVALAIPEPSARRTRLHLVAEGRLVEVSPGRWRTRRPWEIPARYAGKQVRS